MTTIEHAGHDPDAAQEHTEHTDSHSPAHAHPHVHDSHEKGEKTGARHHDHASRHEEETGGTVLTVRALSGLSGDMMLGGLAGLAGLTPGELDALVNELRLPALSGCLKVEARSVNQIAGLGCRIDLPHEHAHRSLADIRGVIDNSAMPDRTKELAAQTFALLAEAEAAVHDKAVDSVTFHEVGALDSILDICLVCRIFTLLGPARLYCSPIPLADGAIHCAHGWIPSPAPAVLRMLENVPVRGFPGQGETITPTALALLKSLGARFGGWPEMIVHKTVISYGGKVFPDAPNGAVWALGLA